MVSILLQATKSDLLNRYNKHNKKPRVKARTFLVVKHSVVEGSKSCIITWDKLQDEHECVGAFHTLKIARAFKDLLNLN